MPAIFEAVVNCLALLEGPSIVSRLRGPITPPRAHAGAGASVGAGRGSSATVDVAAATVTTDDGAAEEVYTIDQANAAWIQATLAAAGVASTTDASPSWLVNRLISFAATESGRSAQFEAALFTKKRGCNRAKVKVKESLSISPTGKRFLAEMGETYGIADSGKALRIVLDYALEELSQDAAAERTMLGLV
jgi:hypothetical protein